MYEFIQFYNFDRNMTVRIFKFEMKIHNYMKNQYLLM